MTDENQHDEPQTPADDTQTQYVPAGAPQWADWDEPWEPPPTDPPVADPPAAPVDADPVTPAYPAEPAEERTDSEPAEELTESEPQAESAPPQFAPAQFEAEDFPPPAQPDFSLQRDFSVPPDYSVPPGQPGPEGWAASPGWSPYTSQPGQPTIPPEPGATSPSKVASFANVHALRVLAQVACPVLLLIGLSFGADGGENGWHAYTAWAIFAAVCSVLQLAPLMGRSLSLTPENSWFLAAVGTAALVGYWVVIVLPGVSSNAGFAQTLAAGLAVIGLWLSPGRRV